MDTEILNFSKAFDAVLQEYLLYKLSYYVIQGTSTLSTLHNNDHLDNIKSCVRLLADNCLLCRMLKSMADQTDLQQQLYALME